MTDPFCIEELDAAGAERELPALAGILHACVAGGASVNFVLPFTGDDAAAWWRAKALPAMRAGHRRLLAARLGGRVVGTAQLDTGTPPNQAHRADVMKVLVHPDFRRRGIARALMLALEDLARAEGRTLLTLDTREGPGGGQPLYASIGYALAGVIPGFARAPDAKRLEGAAFMYKELA